jgi:crotonobetainyl-CoA:carnitine CoA-transferase CaiB-like acyl-CoA transferase
VTERAAGKELRKTHRLRGFRVLDACDELGVYATRLLVNLGADVIRLEPPGGDPDALLPPLVEGVSLYFDTSTRASAV